MLPQTRLFIGLGAAAAAASLGCVAANATEVHAGVVARVPLACAVSDVMVRSEDATSLTGSINEGCNAPGGYDVYAQLPDRARLEGVDSVSISDTSGLVRIGGENGPAVRERELKISFAGTPVGPGEIVVSIVPR